MKEHRTLQEQQDDLRIALRALLDALADAMRLQDLNDWLVRVLYLGGRREFHCFFHFLGWHCWSLGVHVDPLGPVLEVHVPTGFIRVGWLLCEWHVRPRTFGKDR